MRASELLGRVAYDQEGHRLGKIADLLTEAGPDGTHQLVAALVTPGHRGRLLGYERPGINAPWLINRLAAVLHRGAREIPWADIRLDSPSEQ
ncbi:PRC-barrel domain containing protein [Amycolatopsis sp. NPDC051071]|uniref:PRC-barrel domain-containing protein n=1 Tax=Amycolatopsis sp. NPDC051071 TaxID=3154637 RepID=UPI003441B063